MEPTSPSWSTPPKHDALIGVCCRRPQSRYVAQHITLVCSASLRGSLGRLDHGTRARFGALQSEVVWLHLESESRYVLLNGSKGQSCRNATCSGDLDQQTFNYKEPVEVVWALYCRDRLVPDRAVSDTSQWMETSGQSQDLLGRLYLGNCCFN